MNKILQLLVDDFLDRNVNEEYKSLQKKVSAIEKPFIDSLTDDQVKVYFEIESLVFYSLRADKVLLLSLVDHKVAVLYNAGQKIEIRPNTHRARALRNAEKRRLRLLQKNIDIVKSSVAENALELLNNLDKVHTTEMGVERIRRNLGLDCDIVDWCKEQISKSDNIVRRGKNWYAHIDDVVITVNAYSYTIITAHRSKR